MGEVHVVEHVEFGTRGVLKLLREEFGENADLESRLRAEARVMKRLEHPNLVRVLDFARTGTGRPFLVTELLDGETLGDLLRREKTLSESEAVQIGIELLAGLEVVHAAGIVHRDVKPDNIFLARTPNGGRVVKLLDFGVAKLLTEAAKEIAGPVIPTATGIMVGTPSFMAPEQVRSDPVDHRTDLYSVGAMLFRIVVGEPPFVGKNQVDILQAHLFETPRSPSSAARQPITVRFSEVVLRALEKAPTDRFESATAMRLALEALAQGAEVHWAETAKLPKLASKTEPLPKVAVTARLEAPQTDEDEREGTTYTERGRLPDRRVQARGAALPRHTRPLEAAPIVAAPVEDDGPTVIEPQPRGAEPGGSEVKRLRLTIAILVLLLLGLITFIALRGFGR